MQIETKELTVLKGQVSKLENQANAVTIGTQEEYALAVDIVAKLKAFDSELTQKKESITKPLNEALRNARAIFAPIEAQFEKAEAIIKGKLLDYKRKKDAEVAAKEAKIAEKVGDGRMKIETAEKKIEAIERVETTTRGKVGEVQIRKVKKFRIVDAVALPRQYLIPDLVLIRRDAVNNNIRIPGVEVYEEETVAAGSF